MADLVFIGQILGIIAGCAVPIGAVVYITGLKGRIDGHDVLFAEREKQDDLREANAAKRHEDLCARFEKLDTKFDKLVEKR